MYYTYGALWLWGNENVCGVACFAGFPPFIDCRNYKWTYFGTHVLLVLDIFHQTGSNSSASSGNRNCFNIFLLENCWRGLGLIIVSFYLNIKFGAALFCFIFPVDEKPLWIFRIWHSKIQFHLSNLNFPNWKKNELSQCSPSENNAHSQTLIRSKFFTIVDFNAKHRSWNNTQKYVNGKILFHDFSAVYYIIEYPSMFSFSQKSFTIDLILSDSCQLCC